MQQSELIVGQRVRLINEVHIDWVGTVNPGPVGKVVERFKNSGDELIALVEFEEPVAHLAEWDNRLQVWADDSGGLEDFCSARFFELAPAQEGAAA